MTLKEVLALIETFNEQYPNVEFYLGHIHISDYNLSAKGIRQTLREQFTPFGKISESWKMGLVDTDGESLDDMTVAATFGFLNMLMSICEHQDDYFEDEYQQE